MVVVVVVVLESCGGRYSSNRLVERHSSLRTYTLHPSCVEQNLFLIQQNKGKRAQCAQQHPGQYLEAACVSACCLPSQNPFSPLFLLKEPLFSAFIGNAANKQTNKTPNTQALPFFRFYESKGCPQHMALSLR